MAGKKTCEVIANFIIERRYSRFVELGVAEGKLLRSLMNNERVRKIITSYYAIDLWKDYHDVSNEKWEQYYQEINAMRKDWPQLHVLRKDVTNASFSFYRGSVDLVFIDADHSYEAVKNDIRTWLPKVRRGGLLLGHDYNHRKVKRAVDEIFDSVETTCAAPTWAFEVGWAYFHKIKDRNLRMVMEP